jgi:hypothetical protein
MNSTPPEVGIEKEYSQGVCEDGAAILCDGQPLTIEEILDGLRERDKALGKLAAMESQEPVASVYKGAHVSWHVKDDQDWQPLYAKPVPADKPAVAVPYSAIARICESYLRYWDGCEDTFEPGELFDRWSQTESGAELLAAAPPHSQQSAGDWLPVSVALPPEGEPFQAFHESWVDEDFNVYGIRECHRYGDGTQYASAKWFDHQDCWIEDSEVPQLWRPYVKPDRCPSHESEQVPAVAVPDVLQKLRLEVAEAINILAMCGDQTPVDQLGKKLAAALNASARSHSQLSADAVKAFCKDIGLYDPEYDDQEYIEVSRHKLKEHVESLYDRRPSHESEQSDSPAPDSERGT